MPRQPAPARPAAPVQAVTGAAAGLPTYALYGEQGVTQATDWLHCESIAERSRRHDWEIRPHRHQVLFQILYMRQGTARAAVESAQLLLTGPCVLRVPALVPHGFLFEPTVDGVVITVLEAHLKRLLQAQPSLAEGLLTPQLLAWPPGEPVAPVASGVAEGPGGTAAAQVAQAVDHLLAEFNAQRPWRALALDAALLQLVLLLARLSPAHQPLAAGGAAGGLAAGFSTPRSPSRAQAHVQRFQSLVERRFRQQPPLALLAAELGITPTQLNRVCQQVLGHSALGVLHARLVLEAQRELTYTTQPVKQVAHALGFADSGYFTRFFQRQCGHTPTAWRALTLAER